MHPFLRVCVWFLVMFLIAVIHYIIPRQELIFRYTVAFTFLLWLVVGAAYGLRGIFRFIMSRGQ